MGDLAWLLECKNGGRRSLAGDERQARGAVECAGTRVCVLLGAPAHVTTSARDVRCMLTRDAETARGLNIACGRRARTKGWGLGARGEGEHGVRHRGSV